MSGSARLRRLLSPGRIGSLELRNRIAMAPMGSNLADENGAVSERLTRYYEARARGGVGLVIVEVAAVDFPRGAAMPRQIGLSDDRFVAGLVRLAEAIHRHGAAAAIQLQHAGKISMRDLIDGRPLSVPSAIPLPTGAVLEDLTPEEIGQMTRRYAKAGAGGSRIHELSEPEIAQLVARFAEAAERAKRSGFDGVEIHAGHGYLIAAFLSRASNRRSDAYGGDLDGRARFLVDVIRAVRAAVGDDFPVWCRLDGREFGAEEGIAVEEARETARLAEAAGIDAIHVSAYGGPAGIGFTQGPLVHEPGGLLPLAAGIKRVVGVPVIAVGRITPQQGELALAQRQADFIAMGRPLLADPELPNKLMQDRPRDVRPCVYCYTCVGRIFLNEPVRCAVNPSTGAELEFAIEKAQPRKQILIAGGGPAGLEVARVAAVRGHTVTLCEEREQLGGALLLSSRLAGEYERLVDYLVTQVQNLSVAVRLGLEVTPQLVEELQPDVTVLAVGARPAPPRIPGAELDHVLDGEGLLRLLVSADAGGRSRWRSARQWMGRALQRSAHRSAGSPAPPARERPVGERVTIVGGDLVGLALAEFLVERGRRVTVLEEGEALGRSQAIPLRWRTLHGLRECAVALERGARVEEITAEDVVYQQAGERTRVSADTVILASGAVPDQTLAEALRARGARVELVGDCRDLGTVASSIADGNRIGRTL